MDVVVLSRMQFAAYPFVVIDRLTVWQAASSPESLRGILIGVCVTLPVIVGYTGFSYRVFRGQNHRVRPCMSGRLSWPTLLGFARFTR